MRINCTIEKKDNLVNDIYKMTFNAGCSTFKRPGQYGVIEIGGRSKPYQVCEFDSERFTIVYDACDDISKSLSDLNIGDEVTVDAGLGTGFSADDLPDEVCIVANGMGIPEMVGVARSLLMRGSTCRTILEYPCKEDIFLLDSFKTLVSEIEVVTLDGSNGREGTAVDVVKDDAYVLAAGTMDMLRQLAAKVPAGQFSLGSSVLMQADDYKDCSVETVYGSKDCSTDGPVFHRDAIKWDVL